MPISESEQRQLRQLEAQLAHERQLVRLARRLGTAGADIGVRRTALLAGAGGCTGLLLAIAGAVVHTAVLGTIGVGVLTATVVLSGLALITLGVRGYRRDQRLSHWR